jgi:hypothetical protein
MQRISASTGMNGELLELRLLAAGSDLKRACAPRSTAAAVVDSANRLLRLGIVHDLANTLDDRVYLGLCRPLEDIQERFVRQCICTHRFSCLVDRFGKRCGQQPQLGGLLWSFALFRHASYPGPVGQRPPIVAAAARQFCELRSQWTTTTEPDERTPAARTGIRHRRKRTTMTMLKQPPESTLRQYSRLSAPANTPWNPGSNDHSRTGATDDQRTEAQLIGEWSNFCLGELAAASALAGLLFVSVSVNQARILQLGRMADRGLEALAMLFLVVVVASLPLVPRQPLRLLGGEILVIATVTLFVVIRLQRTYLRDVEPQYRPQSMRMVTLNRTAVGTIALAGGVLLYRTDGVGMYFLPAGILLSFLAAGFNSWVLLIEINR